MSPPTSRHNRWEPADLVQHQVVSAIASRQQNVPRVVFKGGTLLRVCYRHDWRFSEDLDFDWIHTDDSKQAIHDFFDRVLKAATRAYGTAFNTKWGANKLNIYWEQPAAVTGVIYTDVKPRHHLGARPTAVPWAILDRYPQIDTDNPILGYSPASMLAAKLDCIANPHRLAPRDYYDLHRLLQDLSIDNGAALDEFTARHTATQPPTTGRDWFDILFDNAYQHETELADRWIEMTRTGMIQDPHPDFAAILDTVTDAVQLALDDYTATTRNTIDSPGLDRPGGTGLDL